MKEKVFSVLLNCKLSLFFFLYCVFTPNATHYMQHSKIRTLSDPQFPWTSFQILSSVTFLLLFTSGREASLVQGTNIKSGMKSRRRTKLVQFFLDQFSPFHRLVLPVSRTTKLVYLFPYTHRNGEMQIRESSYFGIFHAVTYARNLKQFSRNFFLKCNYFTFLSLFSQICLLVITVVVFFDVILTIT